MKKCNHWSQNCHVLDRGTSILCARYYQVHCPNLDGWKHYPDSPFGNVDICPHGVCRTHGTQDEKCRFCDI